MRKNEKIEFLKTVLEWDWIRQEQKDIVATVLSSDDTKKGMYSKANRIKRMYSYYKDKEGVHNSLIASDSFKK